jgi:hypothetical protein
VDRSAFVERLARASEFCVEFTGNFVLDVLPDDFKYFVFLNQSYDAGRLRDGLVTFPDNRTKYPNPNGPIDADRVASVIWREGMVPQWIDISVWGTDQEITYFRLLCAGRFTAREELLYYTWNSWRELPVAPFGVKGPCPSRLPLAPTCGEVIEKFTLAEAHPDFPFLEKE